LEWRYVEDLGVYRPGLYRKKIRGEERGKKEERGGVNVSSFLQR